jgi:hypothetical protein
MMSNPTAATATVPPADLAPRPTAADADRWPDARAWYARAVLFVYLGLAMLLAQVFVPIEEFIHRGDDAFYYFKVAANYPALRFWTFDGIHATNGVQPLWAVFLTAIAQLCAWVGITDLHLLARVFVGATVLVQFAASAALFHLLARQVSVGTGLVAAGAFLFPLSMVWGRVWGMESPLYALLLAVTVAFYLFRFRPHASATTAIGLGLLLGLTALARLNGGFLIPCLLGFHLLAGSGASWTARLRLVVIAGAAATAVLLPFFTLNYLVTGHALPISGAMKSVLMAQAMEARGIDNRLSIDYLRFIYWEWRTAPSRYIGQRMLDGFWPLGSRLIFRDGGSLRLALPIAAALALLPLLLARPREWARFVGRRFRRLAPLAFFAGFAVLDSVVSVWLYPTQMYAMVRWWMVPNELLLVTLTATLVAASIGFLAARIPSERRRIQLATIAIAIVVVLHARELVRYYWDGELTYVSWNLSWNDEMYRAAQWINVNVPEGERVGSWNAGVVGYYAQRPVINLDGLINDFELLEHIRNRTVAEYIRSRDIRFLSDMDRYFDRAGVRDQLELTEVYSHYSEFMRQPYRIYRVER